LTSHSRKPSPALGGNNCRVNNLTGLAGTDEFTVQATGLEDLAGNALLLISSHEHAEQLRRRPEFLVLESFEEPALRRRKAPVALLVLGAVVLLAALDVMPIVVAALLGCMALILTR